MSSASSPSAASAAAAATASSAQWLCECCGRPGTERCGGCRLIWYCSPACQKGDWKPRHRHLCAAHKRAVAEDAAFATWSPALRLELLATRFVLGTFVGGASTASPFVSSTFAVPSAASASDAHSSAAATQAHAQHTAAIATALSMPASMLPELPRLACRWFHQAARFSSLGLRDAGAYLDWTWDGEHIAPATRVAALMAQWSHVRGKQ
jgi:hypothetical protein